MEVGRPLTLALAALALVLAAPLATEVVQADDTVEEDQPHLLVRVENEAAEERQVQATIEGPSSWSSQVTLEPGEVWERRHEGPPGSYEVEIVHETPASRSQGSAQATTEGCLGPHLTPFRFTAAGGIAVRGGGCLGEPAHFFTLVDEARQAREQDASTTVDVPTPRDGTEGRYLLWDAFAAPDWEQAHGVPFAWLGNASFHDAWGGTVEGTELAYLTPYHATGSARSPLFEAESISEGIQDRLRFAPGQPRPATKTGPVGGSSAASPLGASAEVRWEVTYQPRPTLLDCALRNAQQGHQLSEDQARAPCPGADEQLAWWTGPGPDVRGLETLAQYGLDDREEPSRVAKLVWADGLAYPVLAETFTYDREGPHGFHQALKLANLSVAGDPLPLAGARGAGTDAGIDQAPLAPLEGPRLRDADRVPFPLAEAARTAAADPTLRELQDLLASDEAILAGAQLAPDADTDAGDVRTLTWTLAFTAPDGGPILVACQRPTAETADARLSPPAADCRELDEAPQGARHLEQLPRRGSQALPSRAATWDAALDRWRLLDPPNASASLTLARYLPLLPVHASSQSRLVVGTGEEGPHAGPSEPSDGATTVAVSLEDGRTLTYRTGVMAYEGLTEPVAALSPSAATPGGDGLGIDADPVVGAAAGAGLLGLLALAVFALYSRLQDDEVLAHDTRRQIRDLVEAEPGIHANAIARRVDANDRTVEHHLDVLLREDVLTVLERGGYNHHFVQGQHTPKEMQALASLQRGRAEEVYEAVRQDPGMDLSTLAEAADISKAYASKLVDQLVDAGLVDRVRDGRSARLYANEVRA